MVHVVCFGNLWQGDDGFGVHVFRRLTRAGRLPAGARLFEAGTAGLGALPYFDDCRKAVLVDAVKAGGRVGGVRRFFPEDFGPPGEEFSTHGLGAHHLLAALPAVFEGRPMPRVVLVGAEVGPIAPFTDRLSPPLEAAVGRAVRLVWRECVT